MPNCTEQPRATAPSWVEHWLDRYCGPDEHDFALLTPQTLGCRRCGKVTVIVRATCVICEIPGERSVSLMHGANPARRLVGELCGSCSDEFTVRGEIRGWVLVPGARF